MDPATEKILLIGEGGTELEEKAASYISEHISKPIIGFVAGKKEGIENDLDKLKSENENELGSGSVDIKIDALKSAGVKIAALPNEIPALLMSV